MISIYNIFNMIKEKLKIIISIKHNWYLRTKPVRTENKKNGTKLSMLLNVVKVVSLSQGCEDG